MGRSQWIAVAITSLLLVVTYLGCPVQTPDLAEGLTTAPLATTGLESLIREARAGLNPARMATLASLEERLETQTDEDQRADLLEQLAGEWYDAGHPAISGIYAKEIADLTGTEEAWAIAGSTFTICLQREQAPGKKRQFCAVEAERAYQAAISLSPDEVDYRIALAMTYVDAPREGGPMKGILMLRDLADRYPDEVSVYTTLAQLAIKTNQLDKAAERLEQALQLEPDNPDALCPLARVYENLGNSEKSAIFAARCTEVIERKTLEANN